MTLSSSCGSSLSWSVSEASTFWIESREFSPWRRMFEVGCTASAIELRRPFAIEVYAPPRCSGPSSLYLRISLREVASGHGIGAWRPAPISQLSDADPTLTYIVQGSRLSETNFFSG